jgi:hypothetical protein
MVRSSGGVCALDEAGEIACAHYLLSHPITASPPGPFVDLSVGSWAACARMADDSLACWGDDGWDPPIDKALDVTVGQALACAIALDGEIVCWGFGSSEYLDIPEGPFMKLSRGTDAVCGIRADGSTTCFREDTQPEIAAPAGAFDAVATGSNSSRCGIRQDKRLVCWGGAAFNITMADFL